jgi:hypothetical protein
MRCQCCNTALNDYESTIRHAITKQFVEMCSTCLKSIDAHVPLQVRNDLLSDNDMNVLDSLLDADVDYIEDFDDYGMGEYWDER